MKKQLIKLGLVTLAAMVLFSACNRYIACPAYSEKNIEIKLEEKNDIPS
jgi:hypothetical protein